MRRHLPGSNRGTTCLLRNALLGAVAVLTCLLLPLGTPRPATAGGANLTGRTAPEMVFGETTGALAAGQRLSALRGEVVWIKFWLRDCPVCRRSMPLAERMHREYGDLGLRVITVVHKYGPSDVMPLLRKHGWTMPVAYDRDGSMARSYHVRRRPGDYLIGFDGRVAVSNNATQSQIEQLLGARRVHALGQLPPGTPAGAEAAVRQGRYGAALRTIEPLAASSSALTSLAAVVRAEAQTWVKAKHARIEALRRQRQGAQARTEAVALVAEYQGTSMAGTVAALVGALASGR